MSRLKKWTEAQLVEAVESSYSIAQVLKALGLKPLGGNYSTAHKYIKKLDLNTDHFKGQASNSGKNFGPKRPIEDFLSNSVAIQSYKLKLKLFQEGLLEQRCYRCGVSEWMGAKAPLELEHIDGNSSNNTFSNLTILCPNCHAQTPTYRNKKR
jgi:hypothetical protein